MKTRRTTAGHSVRKRRRRRRLFLEQLEPRLLLDGEFWLSALAVTGAAGAPFDKLEVEFSNTVDETTFDAGDVRSRRDPFGVAGPGQNLHAPIAN